MILPIKVAVRISQLCVWLRAHRVPVSCTVKLVRKSLPPVVDADGVRWANYAFTGWAKITLGYSRA